MDYIIKDGWIVNGKKEKPFYGDLVIENGKIAEVELMWRFQPIFQKSVF